MIKDDEQPLEPRLESYRSCLLFLAKTHMGRSEQPRLDPSDIVQESLLEAHRDRERFRGNRSEREQRVDEAIAEFFRARESGQPLG